jgi:hypothetical protein
MESEQPQATATAKQALDRSTIQFPYGDLSDGISVAQGLLNRGGVPSAPDELAAAMGSSPISGSFRMKITTARIFGLIETVQGKYNLTELGFAITDASREKAARVDAFLTVPLYRRLYDEFRNRQLPPRPVALEHALVGFGVAPKQKDKARQAFDRSAQQAGFFDQGGRDRLIRPNVASLDEGFIAPDAGPAPPPPAGDGGRGRSGGTGGGDGGGYHPFVQGLLQTLPEPGTVWTMDGRAAWLETAATAFKLIYKGDGRITVTVAPATPQQKTGADQ